MTFTTRLLAAFALTAAGLTAAVAAPVTAQQSVALQQGSNADTKTAGFSIVHSVAGEFIDTFVFSDIERWGVVNASLTTIGMSTAFDINFVSAVLNGATYSFTRTTMGGYRNALEIAALPDIRLSGPLVLTVRGYAGQGLTAGTPISASYSGTINVTQVPEPGTLALAVLALLGVSLIVARRRAALARTGAAAALLAMAATGAQAANWDQDIALGGAGAGLTAAPFAIHTEAGSFVDTFRFTFTGTGWVDASLITVYAGQNQQISFTEATLNGRSLGVGSIEGDGAGTNWISASLPRQLVPGDYTLVIKGYAGGNLAAGTTGISASYSGTFNVLPASAVPEPQGYAMFLGGLALMAFMLSKRRQRQP
ncbi:FxDxF family double-cut PEP-CTERM protein [Roseateles sp. So40a]|uniref:FxDxF family double-cut PEP-CTERM protein n=1 Tax=Roseateles sp. So40a TaxID=3400226 RepID=UPI003A83E9F9